jgi:3-vinyl bacteriochlorophyllide hydratase
MVPFLQSAVRLDVAAASRAPPRPAKALYTHEQRQRRDATVWTGVQGVLAPLQFVACAVSLVLVCRYLATGEGLGWASASFVVKTVLLYTIMVTGSVWEKVVFDQWLFAPAFFWEDVVSFVVIALHTAVLWGMVTGQWPPRLQMTVALAAYAAYGVNAAQFLLKLRAARLQERQERQMKLAGNAA